MNAINASGIIFKIYTYTPLCACNNSRVAYVISTFS